jgi:hypothetical protein
MSGADAVAEHFATKKVLTALPYVTQAVLRLVAQGHTSKRPKFGDFQPAPKNYADSEVIR